MRVASSLPVRAPGNSWFIFWATVGSWRLVGVVE